MQGSSEGQVAAVRPLRPGGPAGGFWAGLCRDLSILEGSSWLLWGAPMEAGWGGQAWVQQVQHSEPQDRTDDNFGLWQKGI